MGPKMENSIFYLYCTSISLWLFSIRNDIKNCTAFDSSHRQFGTNFYLIFSTYFIIRQDIIEVDEVIFTV